MTEAVTKNAVLVAQEFKLAFDQSGVEYLDAFITRQHERLEEISVSGLTQTLGSFLGECIVRNYDGVWEQDEYGWAVRLSGGSRAYPFVKVQKQLENGPADSVASFYRTIPALLEYTE